MINNEHKNIDYEIIIKPNYVYIKNYNSLIEISKTRILIKKLSIEGNNLIICKMDKYDLMIKGIIKGIMFYE